MITTGRGLTPAGSYLDPPRPLRLRRAAALRVLMRPRRTARLLEDLAAGADVNRLATGAVLRACIQAHMPRR